MAVVLSLLAAVVYGTADFGGGLASRRAPAIQVALLSQVFGCAVLVPLVVVADGVVLVDLLWGMAAGFFGGLAITAFYEALAGGKMGVVAPVSAVTAVGIPVVFALITGERPVALQVVGILLALAAIVLVSQEQPDAPAPVGEGATPPVAHVEEAGEEQRRLSPRGALLLSLLAGALFAPLYICFDQAGDGAVPWALVGARLGSIPTLLVLAGVTRTSLRPDRALLPLLLGVGVFDMLANVFIVLALDEGLLTVVAVISSLYPAMTVLLARVLLHERLRRVQVVGLWSALAAIGMISAG
jgi:drug/metabolite transporter (DMT)-like permease